MLFSRTLLWIKLSRSVDLLGDRSFDPPTGFQISPVPTRWSTLPSMGLGAYVASSSLYQPPPTSIPKGASATPLGHCSFFGGG
jgi:hypothetical protein